MTVYVQFMDEAGIISDANEGRTSDTIRYLPILSLTGPAPGVAGEINTLAVTGAIPGATVHFVFGTVIGSTDVPGCPGVAVGIDRATTAGTGVADGSGNARFSQLVPAGAAGVMVRLQAVEQSSCRASNLVTHTFP